ncbi:MAG: TIGR04372 family glycosyltransferase [Planctomycetota bacterium]
MQLKGDGAKLLKTKRKIAYVLAQIDRIGQLADEMFFLRNIYEESEYDIAVVTYPLQLKPRTNIACYNIVIRGTEILHSDDNKFMFFSHNASTDTIQTGQDGREYHFINPSRLRGMFFEKFRRKEPNYFFSLGQDDIRKGQQLRAGFGIPLDAQVVTLHAREAGYMSKLTYHSYRDAQIENFIPAIQYLVRQGYYVVRLGDTSMKPLPHISPQVVDAPFHEAYTDMVDPYFIATAAFHMGSQSGPFSVARGFGVPILLINNPILAADWGLRQSLFVPKKYFSHHLQRYLRYEEILSSFLDSYRTEDYQQNAVELHENTPDEILNAVKEMLLRLQAGYQLDEQARQRYMQIEELQRQTDEYRRRHQLQPPSYGMYGSHMKFSNEFLNMNQWFLQKTAQTDIS